VARILIVEDSPDNMTLFQAVLRLAGHEVIGLMDGGEMLTTVQSTRPDAVLLDIQLPDRDGFALLRKSGPAAISDLPVVALTAHAMAGTRKGPESGFSGYDNKTDQCPNSRQVEGSSPFGNGFA
jgi:two-component system cell cycle response regulator DivK